MRIVASQLLCGEDPARASCDFAQSLRRSTSKAQTGLMKCMLHRCICMNVRCGFLLSGYGSHSIIRLYLPPFDAVSKHPSTPTGIVHGR